VFPFEFLVALGLLFQHLSHPDGVANSVERRFGDVDRDEDVFTTVAPIVHVLPRLHLVGNRIGVIGEDANSTASYSVVGALPTGSRIEYS